MNVVQRAVGGNQRRLELLSGELHRNVEKRPENLENSSHPTASALTTLEAPPSNNAAQEETI